MNCRPLVTVLGCMCMLALPAWGAASILFIAGAPSHGPGEHRFPEGCTLLARALNESGLPVRADVVQGWPADDVLAAAEAIVIYSDGLENHVANGHASDLRKLGAAGKGISILHFALEPAPGELADALLEAVGGRFEPELSVNPVWKLQGARLGDHPVARGVVITPIEDEWYYHLRFLPGVTPVLQAMPPASSLGQDGPRSGNPSVRAALAKGEPQTLAWVYEPAGRRAFGLTGGHFHRNWADDGFRKLVLNAIVWTAGLPVPEQGVASKVAAMPRYVTIDEAVARGDLEDVRLHLHLDPARAQRRPDASLSPLQQAILRNRTEIALALLDAGADPDQPDRSRRTPLHLATERGNVTLAKALLAKHARPNERDQIGWTPLHHAAAKNQLGIAQALLDGGADAMTLSERGGTALHEAAASGSAEMVRLLLDHKVDPNVVSKTGVKALDIAREFKNEPAIKLLEPRTEK